MRRLLAIAALALFAAVLVGRSAALAHAVLEAAVPADGSRLEVSPEEIVLRFSEPVSLTKLELLGPGGEPAGGIGGARTDGGTIRIPLLLPLGEGSYVLSYRVTSLDGHPVAGSVVFGMGREAAAAPPPVADQLTFIAAVNRAAGYAALLAASGGGLFLLLVLGRAPAPATLLIGLIVLAAVAAAALVLSVGINGLQLAGLGPTAIARAEPWKIGAGTTLFGSAAAGLAGLLVLAIGLSRHRAGKGRILVGLGAALALSSLALTGHAATAPPAALSAASVYLHGIAAAFWVGSLWPLWVLLRRLPAAEAFAVVRRFSGLAAASVALLLLSGTVLSAVQLGSIGGIFATPYGRTWLLKIGLVAALLGLAALNRLVLLPRLPKGGPARLGNSIAAEIALAAAILMATSLLGQTPPPRAPAMRDHAGHGHHDGGPPASLELTSGDHFARIEISPASAGRNRIVVTLSDAAGRPPGAAEIVTVWSHRAAGIEGIRRTLKRTAGRFEGDVDLPVSGEWTLGVEALVGDFEKATFRSGVVLAGGAGNP